MFFLCDNLATLILLPELYYMSMCMCAHWWTITSEDEDQCKQFKMSVCVCMTGSCREHNQHVVAADGKWFGGAETFTDGPGPANHQHSRTR